MYTHIHTGRRELMIRAHAALCHPREKHTPTKCNLLFCFPLFRYHRTAGMVGMGWTCVCKGGYGEGRNAAGKVEMVPTSFIKRVGRRPRAVQSGGKLTATPQCRQNVYHINIYIYIQVYIVYEKRDFRWWWWWWWRKSAKVLINAYEWWFSQKNTIQYNII